MTNPPSGSAAALESEEREIAHAAPGVTYHERVGAFPAVELVPITVHGSPVPDYRAIVSTTDRRVLGMHGSRYRLITHEEAFAAVEQCLSASSIRQEGRETHVSFSHHGARAFCDYHFPAEQTNLAQGDAVCLRIVVVNSYDQSSALRVVVGAFRFVCSNGMMIGEEYAGYSHRHTGGLLMDHFTSSLNEGLGVYRRRSAQWRKWRLQAFTHPAAQAMLERVPDLSKLRRKTLLEHFEKEIPLLGQTRWAFFNGLTSWATHGEIQPRYRAREAALRLERERLVSRIMARVR